LRRGVPRSLEQAFSASGLQSAAHLGGTSRTCSWRRSERGHACSPGLQSVALPGGTSCTCSWRRSERGTRLDLRPEEHLQLEEGVPAPRFVVLATLGSSQQFGIFLIEAMHTECYIIIRFGPSSKSILPVHIIFIPPSEPSKYSSPKLIISS
jgi:hypothetical protein